MPRIAAEFCHILCRVFGDIQFSRQNLPHFGFHAVEISYNDGVLWTPYFGAYFGAYFGDSLRITPIVRLVGWAGDEGEFVGGGEAAGFIEIVGRGSP